MGKKRIMEVYCNVVELSEGTFGVEAAAKKVFKKDANALSRNQAALIATVLPNPIAFKLSAPSNYMFQRQAWILKQINNLGGEQILTEWYE